MSYSDFIYEIKQLLVMEDGPYFNKQDYKRKKIKKFISKLQTENHCGRKEQMNILAHVNLQRDS